MTPNFPLLFYFHPVLVANIVGAIIFNAPAARSARRCVIWARRLHKYFYSGVARVAVGALIGYHPAVTQKVES